MYNNVDLLLFELEKGNAQVFTWYREKIVPMQWFGVFRDIILRKKLVDMTDSTCSLRWLLTDEGLKAIEAGGIRQYILDYDLSIPIINGFPKVLSVQTKDGQLIGHYYVSNMKEEMELVNINTTNLIKERLSIRAGSAAISPNSGGSATFNFSGPVNNFQNNQVAIENNKLAANESTKSQKEGPWTKTSVIIAVVSGIVAAVGVYITWLTFAHPLK